MGLREVKTFDCSPEEFYLRSKLDEPPPMELKPFLYLEWYSQNGRVVLELIDPEIEWLEDRPLVVPGSAAHLDTAPPEATAVETESSGPNDEAPSDQAPSDDSPPDQTSDEGQSQFGLGVTTVRLDDDGRPSVEEEFYPSSDSDARDDDDESLLPIDEDLQRQLDKQAEDVDWAIAWDGDSDDSDEIRELKLMDALIERGTGSYLIDLIEKLQLPHPDDVPENEAEGPLKAVLMQLAMFGIQIHVCEHFTPKETYRWLMTDLLPEEIGHRELRHTQWVQCFDTGESSCPACEAKWDREYAERDRKRIEQGPDDAGPSGNAQPPADDIPY